MKYLHHRKANGTNIRKNLVRKDPVRKDPVRKDPVRKDPANTINLKLS
jgi:hypothetical protein